MELEDKFILNNVSFEVLHKSGYQLRKLWEQIFASNLSNSQKNQIHIYQYLWHVFSYKKVECLNGQDAIDAFNKTKKNECYVFYQEDGKAFKLINSMKIKAEDFNDEYDIYVTDKEMTWTYVHTHEESCGPYFYKINSKQF